MTDGPSTSALSTPAAVLYRCFDTADVLLYIGVTSDLTHRERKHNLSSAWWPQVARVTSEPFDHRWQALAAERAAIVSENPRHNRQRHYVVVDSPTVAAEAS